MADDPPKAEGERMRRRIEHLREIRKGVTDAQTQTAIDDAIAEAEGELQAGSEGATAAMPAAPEPAALPETVAPEQPGDAGTPSQQPDDAQNPKPEETP